MLSELYGKWDNQNRMVRDIGSFELVTESLQIDHAETG